VLVQRGQHHIRFQFEAPSELAVVKIASAHGSLALDGKCGLAQHLAKVAVARLLLLQNQTRREVERDVVQENRFQACPVQYKAEHTHKETGPGGFHSSWTSRGIIETPNGRVELASGGEETSYAGIP
jgi:hypothetical protein